MLQKLGTSVKGDVSVLKETVESSEADIVKGLDVKVWLDKDELPHIFKDCHGQ